MSENAYRCNGMVLPMLTHYLKSTLSDSLTHSCHLRFYGKTCYTQFATALTVKRLAPELRCVAGLPHAEHGQVH